MGMDIKEDMNTSTSYQNGDDEKVLIVRCKDCKYFRTPYCKLDIHTDLVSYFRMTENDYCSYGERREE